MINGIKTVRHTHLTINKEVGVYDFGNSALSRSSTGSKYGNRIMITLRIRNLWNVRSYD